MAPLFFVNRRLIFFVTEKTAVKVNKETSKPSYIIPFLKFFIITDDLSRM